MRLSGWAADWDSQSCRVGSCGGTALTRARRRNAVSRGSLSVPVTFAAAARSASRLARNVSNSDSERDSRPSQRASAKQIQREARTAPTSFVSDDHYVKSLEDLASFIDKGRFSETARRPRSSGGRLPAKGRKFRVGPSKAPPSRRAERDSELPDASFYRGNGVYGEDSVDYSEYNWSRTVGNASEDGTRHGTNNTNARRARERQLTPIPKASAHGLDDGARTLNASGLDLEVDVVSSIFGTRQYALELMKPVGLVVGENQEEDLAIVAAVEPGGNAARAGAIKVGDRIVAARLAGDADPRLTNATHAEESTDPIKVKDIIDLLRTKYGERGERVVVTFERRLEQDLADLEAPRPETRSEFISFSNVLRSYMNLESAGIEPERTRNFLLEEAEKLLYVLANLGERKEIVKVYEKLRAGKVTLSAKFYNVLMTALLRTGDAQGSIAVFDSIEEPSLECFTTLIKAYGTKGALEAATRTLQRIRDAGFAPSLQTYNTLISSFVANRKLGLAAQLFDEMKVDGLKPNAVSWNIILNWYASNARGASRIAKTFELFDRMQDSGVAPNLVTFTTLIKACVSSDDFDRTEKVLEEMSLRSLKPDTSTYNTLIDAYARRKLWKEALAVLEQMKREGVKPDSFSYARTICALAGSKQAARAEQLFDEMKSSANIVPNAVVYMGLMSMYADRGQVARVLPLLRDMQANNVSIDHRSMAAVMHACLQGNQPEVAVSVYAKMTKSGIRADSVTNTILARAYALQGDMSTALEVLDSMVRSEDARMHPGVVTYNALLQTAGEKQRADVVLGVFERLLSDPHGVAVNRRTFDALTEAWPADARDAEYLDMLLSAVHLARQRRRYPNGQVYCALMETAVCLKDAERGMATMTSRAQHFRIARNDIKMADAVDRKAALAFKHVMSPTSPTTTTPAPSASRD
ncbi:Pentatricopeptide repeat-containing protein [Porphyridium purpureum]|uniref:Pentatricopeptide repeat-containing protein n=1 Tax=Porphyridium purpureum TaxID=35688 RepID=A0A5J4YUT6_PORPP|nr:Pentatricopeptide repeat-containing protein [Porphyridium purpureum]|eukprot:POR9812..scf229_5